MRRPLVSLVLALSVAAGAPVTAHAEEPLTEARNLYQRGTAKFETADYAGAIELWTDAYAMVPATPETVEVKVLILYNLATAHEKAFEVDGEPSHLRQSLILLDGFEGSLEAVYDDAEAIASERARIDERRAAVKAQLAAIEEKGGGDDKPPVDEPPTKPPVDEPPPEAPPAKPSRGLTIAGAALMGAGGAALGLMTAGLVMSSKANDISDLLPDQVDERRQRFERGRLGETLAIAGGAAAGGLLITGAILLGVGASRARKGGKEQARLAPAPGPGILGFGISGRF
ncbi:MAG: hypothetical protein H6711_32095 [Myxococcales bacterium]|nr:hypothetical protein [Myxococcales bacterium]